MRGAYNGCSSETINEVQNILQMIAVLKGIYQKSTDVIAKILTQPN